VARTLLGPGARGELVEEWQVALRAAGFDARALDGFYGPRTAAATAAFQQAKRMPATGLADHDTWCLGTGRPVPGIDRRCLALTAAIEGHGYCAARGNWDGAWLTWGIIGFTLRHGAVADILRAVNARAPQDMRAAFGEHTEEILAIIASPPAAREAWAGRIADGAELRQPWRGAFAALGMLPLVREIQRDFARARYFRPALNTAVALCFDIHVQNGGIKPAAEERIRAARRPASERELRSVIGNAVADAALPQFRDDVRARKLAIATGEGRVHGMSLVLEHWGLAEVSV
jgi:peptidoglycan hydrolase-like protein with peptidoglycan-binding domain